MRDDIHKKAPVPRTWQTMIKYSMSDAEWSLKGETQAQKAILSLISNQIDEAFIHKVNEIQRNNLFADKEKLSKMLKNSDLSQTEAKIMRSLFRGVSLKEAVELAVQENCSSIFREINCYLLAKSPGEVGKCKEMLERMIKAIRSQSFSEIAKKVSLGQIPSHKAVKHPRLDIDEDLTA